MLNREQPDVSPCIVEHGAWNNKGRGQINAHKEKMMDSAKILVNYQLQQSYEIRW